MRELLSKCKLFFIYTGIFSFFINVLLLTPIFYLLQIIDRVIASQSNQTLLMLTVIVVFALMTEAVLEILRSRLLTRSSIVIQKLLGPLVLEGVLNSSTKNVSHSMGDVGTVRSFLSGKGILAFFDLPWIPFYLVILYLFHPLLAAIAFVGAILLFALTVWDEKATYSSKIAASLASSKSNEFVSASVRNAEAIAALGMQKNVSDRWFSMNEEFLRHHAIASNASSTIVALSRLVRHMVRICGLGTAAYLVLNADLTVGIMIAANLLMNRAMSPIVSAIGAWGSFIDARAAFGRLNELLNKGELAPSPVSLPQPKGDLSVEKILYFLNRDRDILNGVNFDLLGGETLGVIGPSASGKSTLARLLVGVFKPNDGHVRLDGADIYQWAQNDLGQHVGYLPQDVELFSGTVAENIVRLNDVKQYQQEVIDAARRAHIHEMILQLPMGYNTEVGEGGRRLSVGQRQLIALARALFGDPKLVVLDEPNAHLDGESELLLLKIMDELRNSGVTLVVISHKPRILQNADKLLALKNGRVALYGPCEEIMPQVRYSTQDEQTNKRESAEIEKPET